MVYVLDPLPPSPPLPVFHDGGLFYQSDFNALSAHTFGLFNRGQGGFRTRKPMCRSAIGSTTPIVPGVDIVVPFGVVGVDTDGMTGPATSQLSVRTPGYYRIAAILHWDAYVSVTGVTILVNGVNAQINALGSDSRSIGAVSECAAMPYLTVGSTIYVTAYQASGATRYLVTNWAGSFVTAEWLCS